MVWTHGMAQIKSASISNMSKGPNIKFYCCTVVGDTFAGINV